MEKVVLSDEIRNGFLMDREALVDALIFAWQSDWKLGAVLCRASMIPAEMKISIENFQVLAAKAHELFPLIHEKSNLAQRVRPWMANHAGNAGDALWDGKPERAKKILMAGAIKQTLAKTCRPQKEAKDAGKETLKCGLIIKFRERDKSSDWKIVK